MIETNFEFSIGSDVDFEDLVADIGFENNLVAMLTQDEGFENLQIRIYPPKNGECWIFRLDEFEAIVQQAKQRLYELRKTSKDSSSS